MKSIRFFLLVIVALVLADPTLSDEDKPQGSAYGAKYTPRYTETGAESCLVCHSGEKMHAVANNAHGNTEHPNTPTAQHGCESCHGPGSIHISRAHGGRGFPPLTTFGRGSGKSERDVQLDACLGCHAREDHGGEAIQWVGSIHDKRTINCSTCHRVHVLDDPMRDRDEQAKTCYRCHRQQRDEHPRFEDKAIDFDALSCWTCHNVHAVVDEPPASAGGEAD